MQHIDILTVASSDETSVYETPQKFKNLRC